MISVPYFLNITKTSDILILEKDICTLMQCPGRTCTFFQSADYMTLKIAIMHSIQSKLHAVSPADETLCCGDDGGVIHIPGSTLTLFTPKNLSYILINSGSPPSLTSTVQTFSLDPTLQQHAHLFSDVKMTNGQNVAQQQQQQNDERDTETQYLCKRRRTSSIHKPNNPTNMPELSTSMTAQAAKNAAEPTTILAVKTKLDKMEGCFLQARKGSCSEV